MQNLPVPDKMANAPELLAGLEFYYRAFLELTASRPIHFGGAGLLPWSEIKDYCAYHGFKGADLDDAIYLIKKMDSAFIKYQYEKSKESSDDV